MTLTPTAGTVASTTITVRIASAAAQGAISGKVANTSTGATEQDVTVTGTVNTAGGARTPGTVFLEVGGNKSNTSTAAARSKIVKVFIDAGDLSAAANAGGVQSGTFYVKYDPTVLSINESSPGTAGSDIQLGDLLSSFPAGTYNVGTAAGFGPGIVGVGITHATTTFYTGTAGGHLVELDFHVLQTIPVGNTTLLDLVNSVSGKLTVLADTGGKKYALTPALTTYAGSLTQTGALTPGTLSPANADVADVAIQVIAGTPATTPTALSDSFSVAPSNGSFPTTVTVAGANGVLANDTDAGGPMNAVLVGGSAITIGQRHHQRHLHRDLYAEDGPWQRDAQRPGRLVHLHPRRQLHGHGQLHLPGGGRHQQHAEHHHHGHHPGGRLRQHSAELDDWHGRGQHRQGADQHRQSQPGQQRRPDHGHHRH